MIEPRQESGPHEERPAETGAEMADRLAALSEEEASALLRETIEKLRGELSRLEENYQAIVQLSQENETEGGTDNGSD